MFSWTLTATRMQLLLKRRRCRTLNCAHLATDRGTREGSERHRCFILLVLRLLQLLLKCGGCRALNCADPAAVDRGTREGSKCHRCFIALLMRRLQQPVACGALHSAHLAADAGTGEGSKCHRRWVISLFIRLLKRIRCRALNSAHLAAGDMSTDERRIRRRHAQVAVASAVLGRPSGVDATAHFAAYEREPRARAREVCSAFRVACRRSHRHREAACKQTHTSEAFQETFRIALVNRDAEHARRLRVREHHRERLKAFGRSAGCGHCCGRRQRCAHSCF